MTDRHEIPSDDLSIDELVLPVRAWGCLKRAGFKTVGEVRAAALEDLLALPGFGVTSLRDVELALGASYEDPVKVTRRLAAKRAREARATRGVQARDERRARWLEEFHAGATYQQIGDRYGLSRERVRQVIMPSREDHEAARAARDARSQEIVDRQADEIKAALLAGGDARNIAARFAVRYADVMRVMRGLSDSERTYRRARHTQSELYSDEDLLRALREAAALTGDDRIGTATYNKLRARHGGAWPTAALIYKRLGWSNACELAGLRTSGRPRGFGEPTFTDADMEAALLRVAKILGRGPSQGEYRRLRLDGEPKDGILRVRMGSWTQVRLAANEMLAESS